MNDPLLGHQLANFRLERTIGRGGMAQVYYGYDVKLKRPVAVKVIDARHRDKPAYARRFVREAQAIAGWRHEHIIQIYYADDKDGLYYFAMEYIDGQDLGQLLAQGAKGKLLPQAEVLRIGQAVAGALDYAHERGVIHRDVKPSNVLLAKDGRVVLADFGLALDVEQGSAGEVFGSANYLAPEQARHSAKAVPQSDLYSLGVILYEMLTGRIPFNDPSPTTVAVQHLTLAPPPPRQINPRLNKATEVVLLKALSKSPAERYQTGRQLMDALTKALATQPAAPVHRTKPAAAKTVPKVAKRTSQPKLSYGVGLLLVVVMASAAGYWLWRDKGTLNLPFGLAQATTASAPPTATVSAAGFTPTPLAEVFTPPSVTATARAVTPAAPISSSTPTLTPVATKAPAAPPPTSTLPPPLADSVSEFSGAQGQGNWQYQWSKGRDSFDWIDMQFDGSCWRAPKLGDRVWEDYVRICSTSAHPGAEGDITWRWTSETNGPVQVEVSARKIDTQGGDGVEIVVYRNTEEIKRWPLAANDAVGFTQSFNLEVKQGDYLFFVLKPGADSTHDETAFRSRVVK